MSSKIPDDIAQDLLAAGVHPREAQLAWTMASVIHTMTVNTLFKTLATATATAPQLSPITTAMALRMMQCEIERGMATLTEKLMDAETVNLGSGNPNAPSTTKAFTDMLKEAGIDFDLGKESKP